MFSIGAFSQLTQVSARMLRHYDALGLLRPAHKSEETGYRYYDQTQRSTLLQIETLKSYGFSLAEIRTLIALDASALAQRIQRRRLELYRQLDGLRHTLRQMEDAIREMECCTMLKDSYSVIVMECPAQRVFGLRKTISVAQTHALFEELYDEMQAHGLRRAGVSQLRYLGETFSYESMEVEAQVEVAGEDPAVQILPAATYVAATHCGPYEGVHHAYDAICAWLAEHPEYRVCGPAVERYLRDEGQVRSPEELETGVLFPVERI